MTKNQVDIQATITIPGRLFHLFFKTSFSALKTGFAALLLCIVNKGNFEMTTAESEKLKQSRSKN